jgi:2-methylisocitrate lyase-like PEP mutase family enzyme
MNQFEKGKIFRKLHEQSDAFVIPNPWDVGSARMLAHLGFQALATTSAGFAFSLGQTDNSVSREQVLQHVAEIVSATDLPVSADLENGFGDSPATVAETIKLAAAAGLVGGSIEDATQKPENPLYELEKAVERIEAAAEVVRSLPFTFTLTARAENFLVGRPDLQDVIQRLQAYQEAGADVLYAPGIFRKEDIISVVDSVDRPVNFLMSLRSIELTHRELSAIGVKRISVGSNLACAAYGAFLRAAGEIKSAGTFNYLKEAATYAEITEIMRKF